MLLTCASVTLEAAASESKAPRFTIDAYNGGPMNLGWRYPVVVDLQGMSGLNKSRPIFAHHDPSQIVGHTDSISAVEGKALKATGIVSGTGPAAREVVANAGNGFPWQASIGASVQDYEFVKEGTSAVVNGQAIAGPVYVVRKSVLGEISFVPLGADDSTSATIAASAALHITDKEREAMTTSAKDDGKTVIATAPTTPAPAPVAPEVKAAAVDLNAPEVKAAIKAAVDAGVADHIRASRPAAPAAHVRGEHGRMDIVAAALGLRDKDASLVEAAQREFRGHIGLCQVILAAAQEAGCTHTNFKSHGREILRAAFSNSSLPGILSGVAGKNLLAGWSAYDQGWRMIARIRPVADFKTSTSYRLSVGAKYKKVANNGELEHGTMGEDSFANKADTYGRLISIGRQDIINDDLGAITDVPRQLGRGAAKALNSVFWSAWLDDATFFSTGNDNLITKTGGVALNVAGLDAAYAKFALHKDPDGEPVGGEPAILLCGPALAGTARSIEISTGMVGSTDRAAANTWAGRFKAVSSSHITSATDWYLLRNPQDVPGIEVVFLDGNESPTVEEAEADFGTLGIQMRGFHDFGVAKMDKFCGVKNKAT